MKRFLPRMALMALLTAALPGRAAEGYALPFVWSDQTGRRDMPWLGDGKRARWFVVDRTKPWDFMNPRGPTLETHWGSSGGSGETPDEAADRATAYLESLGFLKPYPLHSSGAHKGAYAFPYRITIVAIQPTVAILRFDLAAAVEDPIEFSFGAYPPSQRDQTELQGLGGSGTPNRVMFGAHIVDRGSLLWFCPEEKVAPTALNLTNGRAEMILRTFRLSVERKGEELEIGWRKR